MSVGRYPPRTEIVLSVQEAQARADEVLEHTTALGEPEDVSRGHLETALRKAEEGERAFRKLTRVLEELVSRTDPPCSGPGFSHRAHGDCPGYAYDRT
jgi:hypothetical protein